MGGDGVVTTTSATSTPTPNDVSIMATSSSVNSSPIRDDHESVLLGVQELERQMNKSNNHNMNAHHHKPKSNNTSMIQRDNPFDSVIPHHHHRDDDTSDTTGNSSYPTSLDDRSSMKRKSSLKKFITTPLKNTGNKFRNFSIESMNNSKHGGNNNNNNNNNSSSSNNYTKTSSTPVPDIEKSILTSEQEEAVWEPHEVKPLIYGYLHKWGRNCQWQRRWFECDGQILAYYKNMKRNKLLATLDLSRVGVIVLSEDDDCTFTIQVSNRYYQLCAENSARAQDWVISLNRAKEARLSIGGMSLVHNRNTNEHTQPVVQLKTRRERLKGYSDLDMDPRFKQHIITNNHTDDSTTNNNNNTTNTNNNTTTTNTNNNNIIHVNKQHHHQDIHHQIILPDLSTSNSADDVFQGKQLFLTGWSKQGRSTMQRISMRLSRWATRMTRLRCIVQENPVYHPDTYLMDPSDNNFSPDPPAKSQAGGPYPLRQSRSFDSSTNNSNNNNSIGNNSSNSNRPRGVSDVDEHMVKQLVDDDKEDLYDSATGTFS